MTVAPTALGLPIVTIIVHGTFAAEETWWRLSKTSETTFADRLEEALSARGFAGTVWRPVLDVGMSYEAFSWSGKNRDNDRRAGACKLRKSLAELAKKLGASPSQPLTVNLIAHSHGGNVVLEALRDIAGSIRVGRVVLLGTPLVSVRPRLRLTRLMISMAMIPMVMMGLLLILYVGMVQLGSLIGRETWSGAPALVLLILFIFLVYGWSLWLLAWVGDFIWSFPGWVWLVLRGRRAGQAYGPTPGSLLAILRGKPMVAFTSHHDEAETALLLSTAPRKLYLDEVKAWGRIGRTFEWIALRPIVEGMLLRALEVPLERFVLGFSFYRLFFWDYEMANLDSGRSYPAHVLKRVDVTEHLDLPAEASSLPANMLVSPQGPAEGQGVDRRAKTLRQSVREVVRNVIEQIKLRHSGYHNNPNVLEQIANELVDTNTGV
ncbi:MAG: hypothetical protein AAB300_04545 [Nitrospirota bacterium]